MNGEVRRLIEDRLPIAVINEIAQREKIGHIASHPRKLHLWWARRPLAAARAAVYAALVPADDRDFNADAEFFGELCRWEASESVLRRAREEILAANGGRAPRVLDMFAGGGAIPLEASRLGCDVTAIDVNPVAYLIEKCTLEYPQRFPGLPDDIRHWGRRWVERAQDQLADIYPTVGKADHQQGLFGQHRNVRRPIAYLWTRTVLCPNPALAEHRVPLVRQTWLARRKGRYVALRPKVDRTSMEVQWQVVAGSRPEDLGFDPSAGSRRGQATCPVCGALVSIDYVKSEGTHGRLGIAPLAAVCVSESGRGRTYLPAGSYELPSDAECFKRLAGLSVAPPEEHLVADYRQAVLVPAYGLTRFRDLFTPRQLLALCTLSEGVLETTAAMQASGVPQDRAAAVATYLAMVLSRVVDVVSTLCPWNAAGEKAEHTFGQQVLPMVWDFAEASPFGGSRGDVGAYVENTARIVEQLTHVPAARVVRGSADALPSPSESYDAIITDPPYYDNISYADLADYFYVWLKRSVGELYPDDFGAQLSPKKPEAVSVVHRFHGDRDQARRFYESRMSACFAEAYRVLKPDSPLVCIYAHKTTLGWSTLIESLRVNGFTISEAWPLDTEKSDRLRSQNSAALASSIFLVARKRGSEAGAGSEAEVVEELDDIVRERLDRLVDSGVAGSDLVIACVGAALRAFTRFDRVLRDNGEELPAERFLLLVQNRVLDAIFGDLARADGATRFYVASQFSYGYGAVPFDEVNNLARMTGTELDGPHGLTSGGNPLVSKKGSTVALRDFEARGDDIHLGLPDHTTGAPAALIDVAQGVLWRAAYRDRELKEYLSAARPDTELLRNVVQALAGRALRTGSGDGKGPEQQAAERLLGAWRHLVEENLLV